MGAANQSLAAPTQRSAVAVTPAAVAEASPPSWRDRDRRGRSCRTRGCSSSRSGNVDRATRPTSKTAPSATMPAPPAEQQRRCLSGSEAARELVAGDVVAGGAAAGTLGAGFSEHADLHQRGTCWSSILHCGAPRQSTLGGGEHPVAPRGRRAWARPTGSWAATRRRRRSMASRFRLGATMMVIRSRRDSSIAALRRVSPPRSTWPLAAASAAPSS